MVVISKLRCEVMRIGAPQGGDAVGGRAARGGGAAVEKRGDLGVGQPGQVVVGHRLTLLGGQGGNRFGELKVVVVVVFRHRPVRCVGHGDGPSGRRAGDGNRRWVSDRYPTS